MWFKKNYEKIFSSEDAIRLLIYHNRADTAKILGSDDFLKAWWASDHFDSVTSVIRSEAELGDIPSIKQMIWLADQFFQQAPNVIRNKMEREKNQIAATMDRIHFCELAITRGLEDRSYVAMDSYHRLYTIIGSRPGSAFSDEVEYAIDGIVRNAKIYLSCKTADPEFIQDVREALEFFGQRADMSKALRK